MKRKIMLDTETTGLEVKDGERIIEIGLVEYEGLTPTGKTYHSFVNPEDRQVNAGAINVHGITNEMLVNAPLFRDIIDDVLDFIGDDADIIIYNAPFDVSFLEAECERINIAFPTENVIDAFQIVKERFPRANKSLNAIAKRYGIDVSKRDLHGALIDADILGQVYKALTQQDELGMTEGVRQVDTGTTARIDAKPILRVSGITGNHLMRCESTYTLLESSLTPEDIVTEGVKHGYDTVALTDRYTTAGAMTFASAIKGANKEKKVIKGVVGVGLDIRGYEGYPFIAYAQDAEGWANIQKLVTLQNVTNKGEGLTSEQMRAHTKGIIATGGGIDGAVAEIIRRKDVDQATKTVKFLAAIYPDRFALEITRTKDFVDERTEAAITRIAYDERLPILGGQIARAKHGEPEMVEILKAIASGGNYDPDAAMGEDFPSVDKVRTLLRSVLHSYENNHWLAERCDYLPGEAKPMLPRYESETGETEEEIIDKAAREGLAELMKKIPEENHQDYLDRIDYELDLIKSQGFSGYFLIVADFIGWAREQGIPVGPGRGSGAGSIVAWALGITKLDPIEMKLLFERFINPDRVNLPDFDIDFCERRREEVIRYVRRKYGQERVVAIGSYNSFQARMALKDVGRVLGQPHGLMDRISKALPPTGEITAEVIASKEIQDLLTTTESAEALRLGAKLHGLLRNRTRHAAGIVIADRPVSDIASLALDPKDDEQAITQYDMKPVEKAGLVKFDFLGLKTLTVIERARENLLKLGIELDPYSLELTDEKTFNALSQGHTTGVFQMESDGITGACRNIRVDNFEDIVAIIALYRPGPMEFIPLYARRKKGLEPFGTPHPLLDDVARDTYGILVYQEQVMKAAQVLAGYTLGQADLLRRAMGKKIKEEMDAQREVFIEGCVKTNNIPKAQAIALFELIERFASYGFNRSHAAAYGLLSFITAWLVNNHSAAFLAAAMDGDSNDSNQLACFAREARRRKIKLLPPRIGPDARYFQAEDEKTIRWSLTAIKGVGHAAITALTSLPRDPTSIEDLIELAGGSINRAQANAMAAAGVFDDIAGSRSAAIMTVRKNYDAMQSEAQAKRQGQISLFDSEPEQTNETVEEIDNKEILELERQVLGVTLSAHPIDEYRAWMQTNAVYDLTSAMPLLEHMPVRVLAQVEEAKITKGKGGWMSVRLSDAQSNIHAGCDESMENAHLLQRGEMVVVQVNAYVSKGERRYQIDAIERVLGADEKVTEQMAPTLIVEVEEIFDREALRKRIATMPEGESRIQIRAEYGQSTTPPIIVADNDTIDAFQSIEGVRSVYLA